MRRTGKTTRKVDEAIQTLFKENYIILPKGECINEMYVWEYPSIIDEDAGISPLAQDEMSRLVYKRLESEHFMMYDTQEFDKYREIKLKSVSN